MASTEITWHAITDAIRSAGSEARVASLDAHGRLVPAREAYAFILNVWYEAEDPRHELMPETWIPNGFIQAYKGR